MANFICVDIESITNPYWEISPKVVLNIPCANPWNTNCIHFLHFKDYTSCYNIQHHGVLFVLGKKIPWIIPSNLGIILSSMNSGILQCVSMLNITPFSQSIGMTFLNNFALSSHAHIQTFKSSRFKTNHHNL